MSTFKDTPRFQKTCISNDWKLFHYRSCPGANRCRMKQNCFNKTRLNKIGNSLFEKFLKAVGFI